jgi:hypothetical protein
MTDESLTLGALGPGWTKSSRSGNGNCVEVRYIDFRVEVRDSKSPEGGTIASSGATWGSFVGFLKTSGAAQSTH